MIKRVLFSMLLLMPSLALADQAYVQASAWAVNRLPIMPGQAEHGRCVVQSSFSGNASMQLVVENKKIRGAVFIVTEPVFKKEGRSIDVTLSANNKAFEFPARTLSKYALAVEISNAYQDEFEKAMRGASMVNLKSGFDVYNFSVSPPQDRIDEAIACTPVEQTPKPIPKPEVTIVEPVVIPEIVSSEPKMPRAPLNEVSKATGMPVVIGGQNQANQAPQAFLVKEAGTNIPLAEALPKIVPSTYTFRFAQGASAGEKISWEAGQDWLETLVLALGDTELQLAVNNNIVTILPSIKAMAMPLDQGGVDTVRSDIIVKEVAFDPSKPPSPGMLDEAKVVLDQLRLDEKDLQVIVGGAVSEGGDEMVALPPKPIIENDNKMKPVMEEEIIGDRDTDTKIADPEIEVYRAKAGENMADVVARWAKQGNIELDMNLQRDYKLTRDVTVQGDINLAASQLMAQFEDIPSAPYVGGDNNIDYVENEKAQAAQVDPVSPVEDRLGVVSNWNAAKDTSLHAALMNWARQGQMQLIWNGEQDVQLPANIKSTTRFGNALEMLLSLYDGQDQRPEIQINHDPDTGLMAMIVTLEKS